MSDDRPDSRYAPGVKRTLSAAGAAVLAVSLAACGTQTDARVAGASTPAEAPSQAPASPPAATTPSEAPSAAPAFTQPYVSIDCATGTAVEVPAPPKGATVDDVTATVLPSGATSITVPTGPAQADALAMAEVAPGTGPAAKAGDLLTVDYCGVGLSSKAMFDSSYARGGAAQFPLTGVIQGWQDGVPGLKVGGTRLLVVPGSLAYGDNPRPGSGIAANETLVFTVTLRKIGN